MLVQRLPEAGTCYGGHALSADTAVPATFPAAAISVADDDGNGFVFSRDEALALIEAIRECLHDA